MFFRKINIFRGAGEAGVSFGEQKLVLVMCICIHYKMQNEIFYLLHHNDFWGGRGGEIEGQFIQIMKIGCK